MFLHYLPVEVLSLVLQLVDSPRDFVSLIIASERCRAVYASAPQLFRRSVLQNAIHPIAMPHALAAIRVPVTKSVQPETLASFVDEYFSEPSPFTFPTDTQGFDSLCRLYNRVSFLIDDYASRARRALGTEEISPLSVTERARFQRAFFRFEVYSLVYPAMKPWGFSNTPPLLAPQAQFSQFLARLEYWEVEEMSCVHFYCISRIGGFINNVEDQLVAAALSTPGVAARTSRYWMDDSDEEYTNKISTKPARYSESEPVGMVNFDCLALTDLNRFSDMNNYNADETVSYLASQGLEFMSQLIHADDIRRRDMIRAYSGIGGRKFLPEAIGAARSNATHPNLPLHDNTYNDDPSRANQGYHLSIRRVHDTDEHRYAYRVGVQDYYPQRERAYVFWDIKRIAQPEVISSLRKAAAMDFDAIDILYKRSARKSVAARLKDVMIPKVEMDKLEKEFGC